jgi:hypothetical protein
MCIAAHPDVKSASGWFDKRDVDQRFVKIGASCAAGGGIEAMPAIPYA